MTKLITKDCFCTCSPEKRTREIKDSAWPEMWKHDLCLRPTRRHAIEVLSMHTGFHLFLGGPLPEDTAYPTEVLLKLGGPSIVGYEWTWETKDSPNLPDDKIRIWRFRGEG